MIRLAAWRPGANGRHVLLCSLVLILAAATYGATPRFCRKFSRKADHVAIKAACWRQDHCGGDRFTVPREFYVSTFCWSKSSTSCEPLPEGISSCDEWVLVTDPTPVPCPDLCPHGTPASVPTLPHAPPHQPEQAQQATPTPAGQHVALPRHMEQDRPVAPLLYVQPDAPGEELLLPRFIQPHQQPQQQQQLASEQQAGGVYMPDPGWQEQWQQPQQGAFYGRELQQQPAASPDVPQLIVLDDSNAISVEEADRLMADDAQMLPMQVRVISVDEAAARVARFLPTSSPSATGSSAPSFSSPSPSPGAVPVVITRVEFPPLYPVVLDRYTAWVLPSIIIVWTLIGALVAFIAYVKRNDPLVHVQFLLPADAQQLAAITPQQELDAAAVAAGATPAEAALARTSSAGSRVEPMEQPAGKAGAVEAKADMDEGSVLHGVAGSRLDLFGADAVGEIVRAKPPAGPANARASITRGEGAVGGFMFSPGVLQEGPVGGSSLRQRARRSGTGSQAEAAGDVESGTVVVASDFALPRPSLTGIPAAVAPPMPPATTSQPDASDESVAELPAPAPGAPQTKSKRTESAPAWQGVVDHGAPAPWQSISWASFGKSRSKRNATAPVASSTDAAAAAATPVATPAGSGTAGSTAGDGVVVVGTQPAASGRGPLAHSKSGLLGRSFKRGAGQVVPVSDEAYLRVSQAGSEALQSPGLLSRAARPTAAAPMSPRGQAALPAGPSRPAESGSPSPRFNVNFAEPAAAARPGSREEGGRQLLAAAAPMPAPVAGRRAKSEHGGAARQLGAAGEEEHGDNVFNVWQGLGAMMGEGGSGSSSEAGGPSMAAGTSLGANSPRLQPPAAAGANVAATEAAPRVPTVGLAALRASGISASGPIHLSGMADAPGARVQPAAAAPALVPMPAQTAVGLGAPAAAARPAPAAAEPATKAASSSGTPASAGRPAAGVPPAKPSPLQRSRTAAGGLEAEGGPRAGRSTSNPAGPQPGKQGPKPRLASIPTASGGQPADEQQRQQPPESEPAQPMKQAW